MACPDCGVDAPINDVVRKRVVVTKTVVKRRDERGRPVDTKEQPDHVLVSYVQFCSRCGYQYEEGTRKEPT